MNAEVKGNLCWDARKNIDEGDPFWQLISNFIGVKSVLHFWRSGGISKVSLLISVW